jgi:hypothetical protein
VVSLPTGASNITSVFADLYFKNTNNEACGTGGTSIMVGPELALTYSAANGTAFCALRGTANGEYITFDTTVMSENDWWNQLCGDNAGNPGYIGVKDWARVYCATSDLSYEAAAGIYEVRVHASAGSSDTPKLYNQFEYLPVAGFDLDRDAFNYGSVIQTSVSTSGWGLNDPDVRWNTNIGDLNFCKAGGINSCNGTSYHENCTEDSDSNDNTIRNLGNVELTLNVEQDRMGVNPVGTTEMIHFKGQLGNGPWVGYGPFEPMNLNTYLGLSEDDELDFGVAAKKLDRDDNTYSGIMTLIGYEHEFGACPTSIHLPAYGCVHN